jgi:LPS sulfotransferase NodH
MLHDLDYLDPAFDQPPGEGGASRLLVLCTTPRAGSHRLGRALFDLGLGVQEEYLDPRVLRILGQRWGVEVDPPSPESTGAYWRQLRRRRARNGVFALSVFGHHLTILERLIVPSDRPVFVHLYRRDAADQVASLLALYRTKRPYEHDYIADDIPDISEISPRSIRLIHRSLALQNRKWRRFLADKPHLSTSCEDFFAHPGEVLRAIAARCGTDPVPSWIDAAAEAVSRSRPYALNAAVKQQILRDHAASFAALRAEDDGAGDRASGPAG